MFLRLLGFVGALVFACAPLRAAWHEASSDHFVIYADQKPEQVRAFAERLERYHAAMSFVFKQSGHKPSPSNRVTIYVVRDQKEVRKLLGRDDQYVAGFYVPRAGGSLAIIPKVDGGDSEANLSGEDILYHEYAHHFMYGTSSQTYPLWLSEGFAEFYAKTKFEKDGSVGLGLPALDRLGELEFSVNVPIERLLDTKAYLASKGKAHDEFYGRSWQLFHYLVLSDKRKGQLSAYLDLLNGRSPELEAAKQAFGDLKVLDKELSAYGRLKKLNYLKIKPSALNIGTISIRQLNAGEAAIMPVLIRSKRGVDKELAAELLPEARKITSQFTGNASVLAALSEAEYDAGNDVEAIAAANAAIALDPKNINAHLQKAYAMARQAEAITDDKEAKKAWNAVRAQLVGVNAIENDHPLPLMHYFMTFARSGAKPTKNAVQGLEWALELAPYDIGLRFTVARQQMIERRFDDAIYTLSPIANSPHQSEMSEVAIKMIEAAETAKSTGSHVELSEKAG